MEPSVSVDFVRASVSGRLGRAARLLATMSEAERRSFPAAVALGEAERVAELLAADPGLACSEHAETGWTPVHVACASRWHVDPARVDGLLETVRLLLDAGADPNARARDRHWRPLLCAVASASAGFSNEPIIRLLLERGAQPEDHDLYLAAFTADRTACLRLLIAAVADVRTIAEQALAGMISERDTEAVRLLLDAGADPNRYRDDDGVPTGAVHAAIVRATPTELIEQLLSHGADPERPGLDGRSPCQVVTALGRSDLAELLHRHGARDDATPADHLLGACMTGDRNTVLRLLGQDGDLVDGLDDAQLATITVAAQAGNIEAVRLMLEAGFPIDAAVGEHGATALHAAAYAGSAAVVELLIEHGADLEARDPTWNSAPLEWALIGSGERPATNPEPDWVRATAALLDAGAATDEITLSPTEPKQPSPEIIDLLVARGIVPMPTAARSP